MALANILMIGLLLRVFYEDIKDRKVTFIVLVILLLLGGFIHSQHQKCMGFLVKFTTKFKYCFNNYLSTLCIC